MVEDAFPALVEELDRRLISSPILLSSEGINYGVQVVHGLLYPLGSDAQELDGSKVELGECKPRPHIVDHELQSLRVR